MIVRTFINRQNPSQDTELRFLKKNDASERSLFYEEKIKLKYLKNKHKT